MKKRILCIILSVCMVLGLLPSIILAYDNPEIPPLIDPDPTIEASSLLTQMEQQIEPVPDDVVTPYEKEDTVTILEKAELYTNISLFSKSFVDTFSNGTRTSENLVRPSKSTILRFTSAVAFDPLGSGKRNHIAILGYATNSDNTNGSAIVSIINADTNTLVKEYELDKDWFGWVKNLDTVDANNYFAITAGDYNGDGRDSLIIYDTIFRGANGDRALKEIAFDGNNWPDEPTNLSVAIQGRELFNPDYVASSLKFSWEPGERLQVALESGDVNGDGIDDLIIVSGAGDLTKEELTGENYKFSDTRIAIVTGKKGTNSVSELITSTPYTRTVTTMTAANVAVGDIDGDGINEIVVAGFRRDGSSKDSVELTDGVLSYRIFDWDDRTFVTLSSSDNLKDISAISKGDSLRTKESAWQQLSVECVSLDGLNSKDYIFINGYFYVYTADGGIQRASGSDALDVTNKKEQKDSNFAFNFLVTHCDGTDVNEVFIRSAAVGNLRADNGGRESIYLIVGFKTNKNNEYFFKAIEIYKDASGKWHQEGGGSSYIHPGGSISNTATGICVSPVDIHDDSIIVRYNSTQSAYTDPNVVAFLQAAPYFSEFGAGNSSTTYSYSESYTQSTTTGSGYSCGVGISASFETPAVKTEVETVITSNVSEEFTESLTTEYTTTFEANDHNQVIIRRTLLYLYCYDLLTGIDENGDPIYEECGLVMSVPQYPVLTSLSMEQYDEFATLYNDKYGMGVSGLSPYYLDLISQNDGALKAKYHLNNEGNPFAYASSVSDYSNGFNMSNSDAWMELSHSGGTSQLAYSTSIGVENSRTATDGVSINLSVSVGSSFAGFGASVGVSSSLESLRSSGMSTGQVTTTQTGGSVQNLGSEEEPYTFLWQLIGWKTDSGDNLFKDVLFVGYAVKNVSAPPACVTDLSVEYTDTPGTAILHWSFPEKQEGRTDGVGVELFRTDNGKRESIAGGRFTSYTVSSDDPSATYVVVVHSKQTPNEPGNLSSIDSNEVLVVFATTVDQVKKLIEDAGADVDSAIAALKKAIEEGQAEAIQKAVEELTAAYQAADALLKAEMDADLSELEKKMTAADAALQSAIDAVQKNLDDAVAALTKLMEDGDAANAEALQKAIADLTAAYQAADDLLKADITALEEKLAALEEKMNSADAALQSAIDAVQKNLDDAVANLNKLMEDGDAANAEALQQAIADLTAAYQAADDLLKTDLSALSESVTLLEAKMLQANQALQAVIETVQKNLDLAIAELTKAAADGDAATIEKLNAAIEALTKAYKAADEALNGSIKELGTSMESADKALQEGQNAMQQEIDMLKSELQTLKDQLATQKQEDSERMESLDTVNSEQETKLGSLKTLATVGVCISVVSLLGNLALLAAFLLEKKKRFTAVH